MKVMHSDSPITEDSQGAVPAPPKSSQEQPCLFDYKLEMPIGPLEESIADFDDQAVRFSRSDGPAFWEEAKSFLRDLTFSVLVAVLVIVFVIQPVRVEGTSMLPHLHNGERIFVNKFIYSSIGKLFYRVNQIERGDIVVFWYPNDPEKSFIKRVIGLPGETVSIHNGVVYINGQPMDEPYLDSRFHHQHDSLPSTFIRNHYYFVMGDNRDSSNDSRRWGLVPQKYIYGKAIFRYWPPGSVGTIK